MKQSKLESKIETVVNIGSGFLVSMAVLAWIVRPAVARGYLTWEDTFLITCVFTISSVIRSYYWRRFFDAGFHRIVHKYLRGLRWVR